MSFQDFIAEREIRKKEEENDKIMGAIIEYFSTHKEPNDEEINQMARDLNIEPDEMKNKIYSLLSDFFNAGSFKENPIEPDNDELEKGIKYEMKTHTSSRAIARKLALDNLVNDEKFYTKLEKEK